MAATAWKRFPVPEFDHRSLKGLTFTEPKTISPEEATRIAEAANSGDSSVVGAYAVEPNSELLERLEFRGDWRQMVLCALPGSGGHLLARSWAWNNQCAFVLDRNAVDADVLYKWRTP
ncbi:MAG: hypothetical protein ACR2OX_12280, partial [Methyloligellaceae bacterium]